MNDKCSICKGCFHPATGAIVSDKVRRCGVCERHFINFLKQHTKRKSSGVNFYDHVETSRNKEK